VSCHSCVVADIGELESASVYSVFDINDDIRSALVFVTTRYSEVFVTSLSNIYYLRTSSRFQ